MTTHYNKIVYKEPSFNPKKKNIATFIFTTVQGAMSKYINKQYRKESLYLNKMISTEDIITYKDFEYKQYGVFCA